MNKWHKKGISPLIATVIIVMISIFAGSLIMWFGKDYVTDVNVDIQSSEGRLTCANDIYVDVIEACHDDKFIHFIIANKRSKKLVNDNFYLRIYQEGNIALQPFAINNLEAGEIKKSRATYAQSSAEGVLYGEPYKIALIPVLRTNNKEILCVDSGKEVALSVCP